VEIQVPHDITFEWTRGNLDNGCKLGYRAADDAIKKL